MGIMDRSCGKGEALKLHGDEPRNPFNKQCRDPTQLTLSSSQPVFQAFLAEVKTCDYRSHLGSSHLADNTWGRHMFSVLFQV